MNVFFICLCGFVFFFFFKHDNMTGDGDDDVMVMNSKVLLHLDNCHCLVLPNPASRITVWMWNKKANNYIVVEVVVVIVVIVVVYTYIFFLSHASSEARKVSRSLFFCLHNTICALLHEWAHRPRWLAKVGALQWRESKKRAQDPSHRCLWHLNLWSPSVVVVVVLLI